MGLFACKHTVVTNRKALKLTTVFYNVFNDINHSKHCFVEKY